MTTSTDGVTWTARTSNLANNAWSVTYGNGLYAVSANSAALSTSTDGVTWTTRAANVGTSTIYALTYGNGVYVLGAAGGAIRTLTPFGSPFILNVYSAV